MGTSAADPRAQFEQIAGDIRQLIEAGELAPGDRIPSVRNLMGQYGMSNQTVQNAVKLLTAEGLIHSVAGRGLYVSQPPAGPSADRSPSDRYLLIMDRLDKLASRMAGFDERLAEVEAELAARRASARPAVRPKSRTT